MKKHILSLLIILLSIAGCTAKIPTDAMVESISKSCIQQNMVAKLKMTPGYNVIECLKVEK